MECWVLTWTCLFGKVLFCFSLLFFPWWWSFYFREVWGWCMLGQKGRRSPWIAVGGTGGGRSTWSKDSGVWHWQLIVRAFAVCASSFGGQETVGAELCLCWGCCTPECCPWPGALPWDESLDHAASASLHPLPVPRWRVGLCWRLRAKIQLRTLEWGQEAGVLRKEPFFSFVTYLSGCLHTLCCAVGLSGDSS